MKLLLEGCIDNKEEVKYFKDNSIDRLELCSDLSKGGLSPILDVVNYAINELKIDSVLMLRNRNDFKFKFLDYFKFKKQINQYKKLGAKKFIFGFLKNNEIDVKACKKVINLLDKDDVYAFHMAIDSTNNYEDSIEKLIELKFSWVLTKGGNGKALDNIENLKNIISKYDDKIKILIGGSVTKENYKEISKKTKGEWFHGRKIK